MKPGTFVPFDQVATIQRTFLFFIIIYIDNLMRYQFLSTGLMLSPFLFFIWHFKKRHRSTMILLGLVYVLDCKFEQETCKSFKLRYKIC